MLILPLHKALFFGVITTINLYQYENILTTNRVFVSYNRLKTTFNDK